MSDPLKAVANMLEQAEDQGIIESYERIPDGNGYGIELSDGTKYFLSIEKV